MSLPLFLFPSHLPRTLSVLFLVSLFRVAPSLPTSLKLFLCYPWFLLSSYLSVSSFHSPPPSNSICTISGFSSLRIPLSPSLPMTSESVATTTTTTTCPAPPCPPPSQSCLYPRPPVPHPDSWPDLMPRVSAGRPNCRVSGVMQGGVLLPLP